MSNVTFVQSNLRRKSRAIAAACAFIATGALGSPGFIDEAKAQAVVEQTSPFCIRRTAAPKVGLTPLGSTQLADRLTERTFRSEALNGQTVGISVLLPSNYDPSGATRYPVLYLFHGRSGDHTDWAKKGGIAAVDQPVITVMPDAGTVGWHADWMGEERFGPDKGKPPPAWETFHIAELIPWIDSNYPTRTDRSGRAIAGLSMGGYGAILYAARHPEIFGVAGSLSGQIDMLAGYPFVPLTQAYAGNLFEMALPDPCVWGDPIRDRIVWEDHSPFQLYSNLRGVNVFLAAGNGVPHKLSKDPVQMVTEIVGEVAFRRMAQGFAKRLDAAAVSYRTHFTRGGHGWTLWPSQLTALYPYVLETASAMGAASSQSAFSYRSAERKFSAWDWSFETTRAVREFTYLEDVGPGGLRAWGSGSLKVTTAAIYQAGRLYDLRFNGSTPVVIPADGQGRLHFTVDLGPSNLVQQSRFDATAKAGFVNNVVTIAAS